MGKLLDRLLNSLSPTQICWVCLLATCGGGLYGVRTFANNHSVDVLTRRVGNVELSIKRSNLQQTSRGISTELFQLRRKVADQQAAKKPVDEIYWDRINQLQNDLVETTRELKATPPPEEEAASKDAVK